MVPFVKDKYWRLKMVIEQLYRFLKELVILMSCKRILSLQGMYLK